ncbi:MAG: DUF3343 domain-containing protein [Coriobacteriia bacterium]|nr:DUF3343 domain-containing protein [Coriobacteriia bacterium]
MTRQPRRFVVLGFGSTHDALDAEALLLDLGLAVVPIPAPRTLGALCGIALRLELADEMRATGYLAAAAIATTGRAELEDV